MRLAFSESIDYIKVKEDGYVLHLDTGRLELLNPVGTYIFDLLDQGRDAEDIPSAVSEAFEAEDACAVEQDVRDFLGSMQERNILCRKGQGHAEEEV